MEECQSKKRKDNGMTNVKGTIVWMAAAVLVAGAAWADTETAGGVDWEFEIVEGGAWVTGAEPTEGTLAIPAELGECPVTGISSNAFDGCVGVTDVVVPGTVTNIGRYAFRKCTGLKSVTIPASVKGIGGDAFYQCTGLEAVHIDDLRGAGFRSEMLTPIRLNTPDGCIWAAKK